MRVQMWMTYYIQEQIIISFIKNVFGFMIIFWFYNLVIEQICEQIVVVFINPLSAGDAFKRIHTVFPQLKFDKNWTNMHV